MSPVQVRRLSDEEASRFFPKRGHMDLSEYEAIFAEAEPGWSFEADRDGLTDRAMKRRLGVAVKRVLGPNAQLRYRASSDTSKLAFMIKPVATDGKPRKARKAK